MRTEEAVYRCSVPFALRKEGRETSVEAGRSAEETSPAAWLLTHSLTSDFILISALHSTECMFGSLKHKSALEKFFRFPDLGWVSDV